MRDLKNWQPCAEPTNAPMDGRYVRIVPFDPEENGEALWTALGSSQSNERLRWFGWPVMHKASDLVERLRNYNENEGWSTCVFESLYDGAVIGMASYMRTDAANGVTEVGAVAHGAAMERSRASTEVHYLMARRVFDELGYRRYEWKLNNLNAPSHAAALRLGFTFEGIFRQHQVTGRGENRDTAWYSMLDSEWPLAKRAFEEWLEASNFDADGRQQRKLQQVRAELQKSGNF